MLARMERIDLLGGSSEQARAEYYRQLNSLIKQRLGGSILRSW